MSDAAVAFDEASPELLRVAYRMLGSMADAEDVLMKRIAPIRGVPRTIRAAKGHEFISKPLDRWAEQPKVPAIRSIVRKAAEAYEKGATLDFSRPGKPIDNAFMKSFNGRLRDKCLSAHWFLSQADTCTKNGAWPRDGNGSRLKHRLAEPPKVRAMRSILERCEVG